MSPFACLNQVRASLLLLLTAALTLPAQQTFWQPLSGPNGGRVANFSILSSGEMIAGTQFNGLLHSTDNGASWRKISNLSATMVPLGEAPGGSLFASGLDDGLLRSDDGGKTWQQKSFGLPTGEIPAMQVDADGNLLVATAEGVYRSLDNGESWTATDLDDVRVLALASVDGTRIYAGSLLGGLLVSTNKGLSWEPKSEGLLPNGSIVTSVAVVDAATVYAGTFGAGVYRSSNAGDTWESLALESSQVIALAPHPDGSLFAGTLSDGAWKITMPDGNAQQLNLPGEDLPGVAVNAAGDIFVGLLGGGIYRSRDRGDSWMHVGLPVTNVPSMVVHPEGFIIAAAQDDGVHTIDSNSAVMKFIGLLNTEVEALAVNSQGHIFAGGADGGIYRTANLGDTWQTLPSAEQTDNSIGAIAVSASSTVVAAHAAGLIRSTDNGDTWSTVSLSNEAAFFSLVYNSEDDAFFAGAIGWIYRSTDDGASWVRFRSDTDFAVNVSLFAAGGQVVYAGQSVDVDVARVLRSDDNGETWTPLGDQLAAGWVSGIFVDPLQRVYAASDAGMFRMASLNGEWEEFGDGLQGNDVVLTLAATTNNRLYIAVENQGVYSGLAPITSVGPPSQLEWDPALFSSPNPANSTARIHFTLEHPGRIVLSVRDLSGRIVRTLLHKIAEAGTHNVGLDTGTLSPGSYFVELRAGHRTAQHPLLIVR